MMKGREKKTMFIIIIIIGLSQSPAQFWADFYRNWMKEMKTRWNGPEW